MLFGYIFLSILSYNDGRNGNGMVCGWMNGWGDYTWDGYRRYYISRINAEPCYFFLEKANKGRNIGSNEK
jgi:hypothetical protein